MSEDQRLKQFKKQNEMDENAEFGEEEKLKFEKTIKTIEKF